MRSSRQLGTCRDGRQCTSPGFIVNQVMLFDQICGASTGNAETGDPVARPIAYGEEMPFLWRGDGWCASITCWRDPLAV